MAADTKQEDPKKIFFSDWICLENPEHVKSLIYYWLTSDFPEDFVIPEHVLIGPFGIPDPCMGNLQQLMAGYWIIEKDLQNRGLTFVRVSKDEGTVVAILKGCSSVATGKTLDEAYANYLRSLQEVLEQKALDMDNGEGIERGLIDDQTLIKRAEDAS